MTPEEEAAWLESMHRGELPAAPWSSKEDRDASRRRRKELEARWLQASHEGKQLECTHHWLLGRPNGASTKGICKKCGAEREFTSSAEDQEHSAYHKARARGRQTRWNRALRSSQQAT
jgi:hypothetical protein